MRMALNSILYCISLFFFVFYNYLILLDCIFHIENAISSKSQGSSSCVC